MAQQTELHVLALPGKTHLPFVAKALADDFDSDLITSIRAWAREYYGRPYAALAIAELTYGYIKNTLNMETLIAHLGYQPRSFNFRERERNQLLKLHFILKSRKRYC